MEDQRIIVWRIELLAILQS